MGKKRTNAGKLHGVSFTALATTALRPETALRLDRIISNKAHKYKLNKRQSSIQWIFPYNLAFNRKLVQQRSRCVVAM